ncbi:FISUMP domain-containing protein [Williamwhitmania taraxaci]|uniref:Major paralogous domain-containing protein n=1 Tax=Williamwhitmania taraxaci TaxID=1640674 RepID=A0A1G6SRL9_9BACT|nr:FISUMP domain-containing protein [Williamwhitmania taraxaci]SDD19418.1 major paralogous domain-containing protein [Williamwhitmania taraxaci]
MKKLFLALIAVVTFFNVGQAQNDTMYVMKAGAVISKYNVNTQVDSIIFYQPTITQGNTFTDSRDGNVYHTVTIGSQVWMVENLKYLPSVVGSGTGSTTTPYYYVYGYNGTVVADAKATANYAIYGVLYNWPAAMNGAASSTVNPSGVQGVCPTGWHLPSDAEWTQLTTFLGGESVAGGKLKEIGTTHWASPNTGADNSSGFTALPGGYRNYGGSFYYIGYGGYWWSATEYDATHARGTVA